MWSLHGAAPIIAEPGGPATLLVPGEAVRLLAVDLPLSSHAKRLEALPFAIEDAIADPLDAVHIALGVEVAPKRYLVGVVRHAVMAAWVEAADEAGLGHAAIVPDMLALPRPGEGEWAVELGDTRALVRAGDGTGFALAAPMLRTAWDAAGRPAIHGYGAPLPDDMGAQAAELAGAPLVQRLVGPALDLRQGAYARRRAAAGMGYGRRIAWIVAAGALAHAGIAVADTIMLRTIAERRADDLRELVALTAPGTALPEDDFAGQVADLIPEPQRASPFLPLVTRVSGALAPHSAGLAVRAMRFEGAQLVLDMDALQPGMAARLTAALADARVDGRVVEAADGSLRLVAQGA
ncbi:general secretion pathway protein GspL [Sphingomonas baiyangensis]|uniref:General secretion pathway protein GspL n=1 Tax=Sphingomonas baiyangensis TaxID=2572576 RepID=A0A4U1L9V2_9SPHN|nr:general secretion pathway protein GspL [Sphingomonas baiyangensis]